MMRHYCLCIYYASTLTRLHLTVSIPGIWVSRNKNVKPFWVLLQQKMMEVAVCNGNIRTCKAPVRTPPATNQHSVFCRSAAIPATQPRVSRHWRQICIHYRAIFPSNQHLHHYRDQWKKCSEKTQTLCAGCSKAEPKFLALPQTPSRGHETAKIKSAGDGHYLYLQTQFG